MSDKISDFRIKRTIKEYDFLRSEYNYINELSDIADGEFLKAINSYLNDRPALKEIYYNKEKNIIDNNFEKVKRESKVNKKDDIENFNITLDKTQNSLNKSNKSKKLYRQIVKLTHPDIVDNIKLNKIYIDATDSYNNDDLTSLYFICSDLNIQFDVDDEDLSFFERDINRINSEINMIKGTFAYDWAQSTDNKSKESLIIKFINNKIK